MIAFLAIMLFVEIILKIQNSLMVFHISIFICGIIALIIAIILKRKFVLDIFIIMLLLMFTFTTSFFIKYLLKIENQSAEKLIFFAILLITFFTFTFFRLYFKQPKNKRNFSTAYQDLVNYLSK